MCFVLISLESPFLFIVSVPRVGSNGMVVPSGPASTRVEPNPNPDVLEVLPKRPLDEVDPNVLLPNILLPPENMILTLFKLARNFAARGL